MVNFTVLSIFQRLPFWIFTIVDISTFQIYFWHTIISFMVPFLSYIPPGVSHPLTSTSESQLPLNFDTMFNISQYSLY